MYRSGTGSVYTPYPYILNDGQEDPKSTESRTLRGGSWDNVARVARAAFRDGIAPGNLYVDRGVRLAFAPAGAGSS